MNELFVHIDVDDLWAIGECYGVEVPGKWKHFVYENALPRASELLESLGIRATLFVCGKDLESPECVEVLRHFVGRGHALANHSYSHSLVFRRLPRAALHEEIVRTHGLAREYLGVELRGFRAPGYGWSPLVLDVLQELGYTYDSSLMASPFGFVFRAMDRRMSRLAGGQPRRKSQYPCWSDTCHRLRPFVARAGRGDAVLWELPVGAAPWLRLPFQASVCVQLGRPYFLSLLALTDLARLRPLVFLLHGADFADWSRVSLPLVRTSRYFRMAVGERVALLAEMLARLKAKRDVVLAEQWFRDNVPCL